MWILSESLPGKSSSGSFKESRPLSDRENHKTAQDNLRKHVRMSAALPLLFEKNLTIRQFFLSGECNSQHNFNHLMQIAVYFLIR
jgi:hypothetical protein